VAWLLPELELGAEPELKPAELEFELEPVELEPEDVEPEDVEPEDVEPEDVEPEDVEPEVEEDEPELGEVPVDDPVDAEVEEAAWCADPGRVSATTPAAATLAIVTVVVADRTLARPRCRSATARRTRSRFTLLMYLILRSRTRSLLHDPSRLAMSVVPARGYPANMKVT
jgi:hypothetical protein